MKRLILPLAFFFAAIMAGKAQDADFREKVQFGLKAGFNASNIYDTEGEDVEADPKIGFAGGALLSIPIGRFLGVQPEVLYSQKGFTFNGAVRGTGYSFVRTTDYLEFPLLGQVKPSRYVTIVAGPQFAYLLRRKDVYNYGELTTTDQEDINNNNIRKNALGFVGGVDFNINHFLISARLGGDLQNNNGDGTATSPRYKNVWFQTTFGFKF